MAREAALSPNIHMVPVRDDVVVLDAQACSYACLVGAAAALSFPVAGVISAGPDILEDLEAAGLVTPDAPLAPRRAPVRPMAELLLDGRASPLQSLETGARALAATARFHLLSFESLVAPPGSGRRRVAAADPRRIAARASAYRRILPFLPFEGLCLQRAWQLRELLASDGLAVDWVFGVRTWPFFAHCWLQHDDRVVADRIERVRAFTPIAVF